MSFQIGTDVGGTFTDLWVVSDSGESEVVKAPTTPDIIGGIMNALALAAERFGLATDEFCAGLGRIGHGTTAGLNALITGNLASAGLIVTDGFADTLEIGRLKRQVAGLSEMEIGDYLQRGRFAPVIPRTRIVGVPERIDRTGTVLLPLDEEATREAVRLLLQSGVEAIGVCTLWSIVRPDHELQIRRIIREEAPDVFVCMSHESSPGLGEYARMSTTAVNASLGPVMGEYFSKLDAAFAAEGARTAVNVMTSTGGSLNAREVTEIPAAALLSGPAAAVVSCIDVASALGFDRVLSIDMGGTSFDVGTVIDGVPLMRSELTIAGADVRFPAIDVATIGAGGGSIAEVRMGALRVGPQSAGSIPGPACYGRGGLRPTVTDADLVLGVLGADDLAGGQIALDAEAAHQALHREVAQPLGMTVEQAAWGIRRVLDSRMADLLRSVTIERGHDPRDFVLVANGGQGPTHAWGLAGELGIRTVVVTPTATVQSAVGTGTSDLRRSDEQPAYLRIPLGAQVTDQQVERLGDAVTSASGRAMEPLVGLVGSGAVTVRTTVAIRFRGQAHHLDVPLGDGDLGTEVIMSLLDRFEREYELQFGPGSSFREAGFEILSVRTVATGNLAKFAVASPTDLLERSGEREVVFDDPNRPVKVPVYRVSQPAPGQKVAGPALIVYPGQTAVLPPASTATTDDLGNLVIELGNDDEQ